MLVIAWNVCDLQRSTEDVWLTMICVVSLLTSFYLVNGIRLKAVRQME